MGMTDTWQGVHADGPPSPTAPVAVVGCGPGSPQYLTDVARQAVAAAEVLAGSRRLLDLFPDHVGEQIAWTADIASLLDQLEVLRTAGRRVAVLVSGDPGLCSLARRVIDRFGRGEVEVIPGISSVQVAFARLGLDWTHACIISAHGRTPEIAWDELPRDGEIAVLAGSRQALCWAAAAARSLESSHAAMLCENLTLADECVRPMTPEQLDSATASSLSLVLLIRRNPI